MDDEYEILTEEEKKLHEAMVQLIEALPDPITIFTISDIVSLLVGEETQFALLLSHAENDVREVACVSNASIGTLGNMLFYSLKRAAQRKRMEAQEAQEIKH